MFMFESLSLQNTALMNVFFSLRFCEALPSGHGQLGFPTVKSVKSQINPWES